MPFKTIQNRFTKGSLNPLLLGRGDIDLYYATAQEMENVISIPYGGFKRRSGFDFLLNVPDKVETLDPTITANNGGDVSFLKNAEDYFITNDLNTWGDNIAFQADFGALVDFSKVSFVSLSKNSGQALASGTLEVQDVFSITATAWDALTQEQEFTTDENHGYVGGEKVRIIIGTEIDVVRTISTIINNKNFAVEGFIIASNPVLENSNVTVCNAPLASIEVVDEGKGYDPLSPPVVTISGDGAGATADAIVSADGRITGYTVTNQGADYTTVDVSVGPPNSADVYLEVEVSVDGLAWSNIGSFSATEAEQNLNFTNAGSIQYMRLMKTSTAHCAISIRQASFFEVTSLTDKARLYSFNVKDDTAFALVVKNQEILIYKNGLLQATVNSDLLLEEYLPELKLSQYANTGILTHSDMPPLRLFRVDDTNWLLDRIEFDSIPTYYFDDEEKFEERGADITLDQPEGTINATSSVNIFTEDDVGQYIDGNGGRMKITEYIDPKKVLGFSTIPFYTSGKIVSGDWKITTNYEPTWSDARGYPKSSCFYQGRLWFGGSKERQQTAWGSRVDAFYTFSPDGGYDNDAIEATLDSGELNSVVNIYPQKSLFIFTEGGEYKFLQNLGEPITPRNLAIFKQSSNGSTIRCSPADIESFMFFVDSKQKAVISMGYSDEQGGENTKNDSLLNSHLVKTPIDFVAETNDRYEQASYLYMPNEEDGTMTTACVLLQQDVIGYTSWITDGVFKSACVAGEILYVLVERDGVLKLEQENVDRLTDSAYFQDSGFTLLVTGLDRFDGKEVDVIIDGVATDRQVVAGGQLTLPSLPTESLEIGLIFVPLVVSNPIEMAQMGTGIAKHKRIAEATLRLSETGNVVFNDSEAELDTTQTIDYTFWGAGYFSEAPQYTITQSVTAPLTVLAVQMNMNYEVQ